MSRTLAAALALGAAWVTLTLLGLAVRPLIPVDETRYAAVAWEMWQRGDWLVPHLNGLPYSHKPPLLFWLIGLGWALAGVGETWPRLIGPLAGLASLALTAGLARRLWPQGASERWLAPLLLLGTAFWAGYQQLLMFDVLLAAVVLAAFHALLGAARGSRLALLGLGVALAVGILTKGPVMLLYTLPAALAAPWWGGAGRRWGARWYLALLAAVALAAALALAWALPAAAAGGGAYGEALLWRQSAGRMVDSFAHRRPWWWYLAITPAVLFPWAWWPTLWRALAGLRRAPADPGVRLALAWLLPALVAFSLISGKQPHYLVPLLPGFALLAARALATLEGGGARLARLPVALALLALAAAWLAAPGLAGERAPWWLAKLHPGWSLGLAGAALLAWAPPARNAAAAAGWGAGAALLLVVSLALGLVRIAAPAWDVRPLATRIAALQAGGRPVANVATSYHGQFQFYGRLRTPLADLRPGELPGWAAAHPRGWAISYPRRLPARPPPGEALVTRYRGRWAVLAPAAWQLRSGSYAAP